RPNAAQRREDAKAEPEEIQEKRRNEWIPGPFGDSPRDDRNGCEQHGREIKFAIFPERAGTEEKRRYHPRGLDPCRKNVRIMPGHQVHRVLPLAGPPGVLETEKNQERENTYPTRGDEGKRTSRPPI